MRRLGTIEPIFNVSDDDNKMIKSIEKNLSSIVVNDVNKRKNLKIKARVRSIYSSLAIEANSLSLESVENIVDNKMVLGDRKEIQEVKNANEVYERISEYDYKSEEDLLKAHKLMMKFFDEDNGFYRNHGEGIKKGNKIIYTAPESILVPSLMKSLFEFLETRNDIHPLILASIFHYCFVWIHPFSDGNGRIARFWVSLILTTWNKNFEYIPIEEEMYLNQEDYYNSIAQCHINGNANVFIDFMLKTINNTLDKTTQKTTQKTNDLKLNANQLKIIKLMKENPYITRKQLAQLLDITADGVKYNLKKLTQIGIVKRVGPVNGGHWQVKGE